MKMLAALTAFWLLPTPLPWGIAPNRETKECAGYSGGDEYMSNSLP